MRFRRPEVKYLGHWVSKDGIAPLSSRVEDLRVFPAPSTKQGLQRFLGMLNYYRRFVPKLADVLLPLHAAVSEAGKKKDIKWTNACQDAFSKAKEALASATLLHHPSPFAGTRLAVDASNSAIGAELSQYGVGRGWCPIAFYSKSLTPAEKKYSAFDRELLAIYLFIDQTLQTFFRGQKFSCSL